MSTVTSQSQIGARREHLPQSLDRRFEAIVFDWDGTAVPDRRADSALIRRQLEQLITLGVDLAVTTGTHVENIDGQLRARPRPRVDCLRTIARDLEPRHPRNRRRGQHDCLVQHRS